MKKARCYNCINHSGVKGGDSYCGLKQKHINADDCCAEYESIGKAALKLALFAIIGVIAALLLKYC